MTGAPVPPDTWLTQYGKDYRAAGGELEFRDRPRFPGETDVSVLIGRLGLAATTVRIRHKRPVVSDAVRYCQVSTLTDAGFIVEATPSQNIAEHGSVTVRHPGGWTDLEAQQFDQSWETP